MPSAAAGEDEITAVPSANASEKDRTENERAAMPNRVAAKVRPKETAALPVPPPLPSLWVFSATTTRQPRFLLKMVLWRVLFMM